MPDQVDPLLIDLLQEGVALARAGAHGPALRTYRKLITAQRAGRRTAAPRFIATALLQTAYSLVDLGRLDEAARVLSDVDRSALQGPQRYDYYLTLGSVLGGLARLPDMVEAFARAIDAADELGDRRLRPAMCWTRMIAFALHAERWAFAAALADAAELADALRDMPGVRARANAARIRARAALGERDGAALDLA